MAEDEMAEVESIALVSRLMVSKAKGKVCLKIIKYDEQGNEIHGVLIHSKNCACGWSDK
jgi:hypothetical protein